jgi:hypothetical protein
MDVRALCATTRIRAHTEGHVAALPAWVHGRITMLKRRILTTVATLGALAFAGFAFGPKLLARGRAASPKYEVEADYGSFEVRCYPPRLVAEVTVSGTAREATQAGFRILADFIYGNNTPRTKLDTTCAADRTAQKIDMTVPVDRTGSGDKWSIAFTMPSEYTRKTLPEPNDPRIRIRQVPARRYAVLRFCGVPSEAGVDRMIQKFTRIVDAHKLERTSVKPIYARYDPPWTPGLLRRNEIFLELAS